MEYKTLMSGKIIPSIAFGTYLSEGNDCYNAVRIATEVGYTHIDTAAFYKNEDLVGKAVRDCGIKRESLFLTTKIWNDFQGREKAQISIENSLKLLDIGYIDMMLIHWPIPTGHKHDYQRLNAETFEVMAKYKEKGLIKHLGISNFLPEHIDQLVNNTGLMPELNQIEMHAGLAQKEIMDYCNSKNIAVSAWRPLLKGLCTNDKLLLSIAHNHGKTPSQVALRYIIEKGAIPIPKSVSESRIKENFDIFSFALSAEEIKDIDSMKENRVGSHPLFLNK